MIDNVLDLNNPDNWVTHKEGELDVLIEIMSDVSLCIYSCNKFNNEATKTYRANNCTLMEFCQGCKTKRSYDINVKLYKDSFGEYDRGILTVTVNGEEV
jgi:hypothetical protein